jgi:hypothetical protein
VQQVGHSHMVVIERTGAAWSWTLVDTGGASAGAGTAPSQQLAMENAWRCARTIGPQAVVGFPEIIVRVGLVEPAQATRPSR